MDELENKGLEQPVAEQTPQVDIAKLIDDLKAKGLKDEEILKALEQMVAEGKLTPELLEEAKKLLETNKTQAEEAWGMKFI